MKKPVLIILGLLFLALISVYFIIPQKIKTSQAIEIDATDVNVARFLVSEALWAKWWPGQHTPADSNLYIFNTARYTLLEGTNSEMKAAIKRDNITLYSHITYAATGDGMCEVTWTNETQSSLNPFTRVAEFIKVKSLKTDIDTLLKGFKKFMQTDSNIYGMDVKISQIQNPVVLASTTGTHDYPTPGVVYSLVAKLRQQIKAQNATGLDSPMLNVHQGEADGYQVMVAIPVNKVITPGKNMVINKLVKGGNLLDATVKGGPKTILNAYTQLKNYQKAHHLISPAMPYEVLVTNRLAQPDTAKWVTRIFWPIF
ncbi:GyrI-like domain-containing protein [Mucilaginibacter phyllosphaerae]|uniref:AraC family transcriptional regulator n=1 Tax=Mucilaginibacter phyllosphaerae TaxID=1812349 RepID=A0A4Y8A9X7_9SPHI|nr:GyrI-like domain-containing protein [Mucilaginibacter phyllosphaerae]MBB3970683.1 hypothetical protein [Mucilaginibacter phyllosphaerae]TEW64684.1 AraC family transcriptional regulator [Mucilaginibacter phyllosphaerae]GGH20261.1 hypothetical protein GCM10007352_32140 [Mucilaginibacter phyllosphaerae]